LRDLSDLAGGKNKSTGPIKRRLERFYMRLCQVSSELGKLDLKKAAAQSAAGKQTLEDFVYNQIDFSRYKVMPEKEFERLFPEGLSDFADEFIAKTLSLGREEIEQAIRKSYQKTDGNYHLQRENPIILSAMRMLETSLENVPLFSAAEIAREIESLPEIMKPKIKRLYPHLVSNLNGADNVHKDGEVTKLSIGASGDLLGTFHPGGKAWTHVLVPAGLL
jgi:hypothetical protein